MCIFSGISMNELVRVEDALSCMVDGRIHREQFVADVKPRCADEYRRAWDCAIELVTAYGSQRKALNAVERFMEGMSHVVREQ